jgi:hypothetical protein
VRARITDVYIHIMAGSNTAAEDRIASVKVIGQILIDSFCLQL